MATDTQLMPSKGGPAPAPTPLPFAGILNLALSTNVRIGGMFATTVSSKETHMPRQAAPSPCWKPPSNVGEIITGRPTVMINGKQAARNGDTAMACNDPVDASVGTVVAAEKVMI